MLITGESGTGKELVARAIHQQGGVASAPFVALNCAAIPETLLESEFFGHERGAFTGAVRAHAGRFEQADGGTLFLDEIGAMRVDLQAKLLRAIQEREIQRLGASSPRRVDVRILAATCEDLAAAIRRASVPRGPVLPAQRRADRPAAAARSDRGRAAARRSTSSRPRRASSAGPSVAVAPEVLERLQGYAWPGNVRELENCIERMVVLAQGPRLEVADVPAQHRRPDTASAAGIDGFELPSRGVRLPELERHLIVQALDRSRGHIRPAARLLGISYKTLQYRIRKHRLERAAFAPDLLVEEAQDGDSA